MYARVAAKSSEEEEEDGAARAERRVGFDRPSCNDERQQGLAGEPDTGGQASLVEADRVRMGATHLLKRRGGDQKGDWVREKASTSSLGGGGGGGGRWSNRLPVAQLSRLASKMG